MFSYFRGMSIIPNFPSDELIHIIYFGEVEDSSLFNRGVVLQIRISPANFLEWVHPDKYMSDQYITKYRQGKKCRKENLTLQELY